MAGDIEALSQPSGDGRIKAKVFGVGSAGCNMITCSEIPSVAVSTSKADIERSGASEHLLISQQRLVGLYHTDSAILSQSPSVVGSDIYSHFDGVDIAFLMTGLGGITGSLGTAVLGQLAKSRGTRSVALVASPFSAESERRREFATECLERICSYTDACVVFGNDALSDLVPSLPLSKAFTVMNGIMHRPMLDMTMVMGRQDAMRIRDMVGDGRFGRFGLGIGRGDDRVRRAVEEAFQSPWFDFDLCDIETAFVVYSAADPWDREQEDIVKQVRQRLGSKKIIHGSYGDLSLRDKIRVSVILLRKS
ncbi:MAG: hypothetical protein JSV94_02465 [Methanobacteriota archaeon]|nr:MAG: hypothetical protein JSV94_02465 [Euryarchaeota archaeon]